MKKLKYPITALLFIATLIVFTGSIGRDPVGKQVEIKELINKMPSPYSGLVSEYNKFIEAEIDTTNNVGAAVAIVCGDSLVMLKPYGVRRKGTADSVDINTVFRLASVSKGFAGVLAAKLAFEKELDLDDKVKTYLPGLSLRDSVNENNLTIKHTLNHTTGLVPHTYDNLIEAHVPLSEIISRLNEVGIAAPPGEVYGYQNVLFSLLDTILMVKKKKSYAELLEERLFEPLEMDDASADYETMANGENIAYPHIYTSRGIIPLEPNKGYYNMAPAAGVNASISDMAKWLKAMLGLKPGVVGDSIRAIITTPTIKTPLRRRYYWRWGNVEEKHYSLGWRIYKYHGYNIIYHGGYVKGYRAEIAFCTELNAGIVFLQNSPNRISSESIPTFWKMYLELFAPEQPTERI